LDTFELVTRFVAVSDFVRAKHIEAGMPGDRIVVKPNFAWPSKRREGPGNYFLYLGRLSPEKGVDTVLRSWHPELGQLVIAGDGPEVHWLQQSSPPEVRFIGPVPPEKIPDLIRGARAVLVPSRGFEAFPHVVVEAYAAGVPIVASRNGALPEVVEGDVTGFLAQPDVPASWTEQIEGLLDDGVSERLGEGAYLRWAERYTPEESLRQLEAIYADAMAAVGREAG
jgi:glycosyltransferase involved in cell wall biosynthesis